VLGSTATRISVQKPTGSVEPQTRLRFSRSVGTFDHPGPSIALAQCSLVHLTAAAGVWLNDASGDSGLELADSKFQVSATQCGTAAPRQLGYCGRLSASVSLAKPLESTCQCCGAREKHITEGSLVGPSAGFLDTVPAASCRSTGVAQVRLWFVPTSALGRNPGELVLRTNLSPLLGKPALRRLTHTWTQTCTQQSKCSQRVRAATDGLKWRDTLASPQPANHAHADELYSVQHQERRQSKDGVSNI
jgi:hypothetical protein